MNIPDRLKLIRLGMGRMGLEAVLVMAILVMGFSLRAPGLGWRDEIIRGVQTKQKVVALTYDDGPNPIYTPEILNILDQYHIKATFFMIGSGMQARPDIVREVVERGNAIGNHTYTHPKNLELGTSGQTLQELDKCERIIQKLTGKRTLLFRPPRGFVDASVYAVAEREGYKTVLWSVCADHHDAPTPELMAERVLKAVKPGSIVLAHDGTYPTRWKDVAATKIIIERLRKQGYRFVTVPELLKMK